MSDWSSQSLMAHGIPNCEHAWHDFVFKERAESVIEGGLGEVLSYKEIQIFETKTARTFKNLLLIPYMIGTAFGSEISIVLGPVRTIGPYVSWSLR